MKTKLDTSGIFDPMKLHSDELKLSLPAHSVRLRNNGIEFLSSKAIAKWSMLTVDLQSPEKDQRIFCKGIVVDCSGNKHLGFVISIFFSGVSPEAQERLTQMVQDQPMP